MSKSRVLKLYLHGNACLLVKVRVSDSFSKLGLKGLNKYLIHSIAFLYCAYFSKSEVHFFTSLQTDDKEE